MNRPLPPPQAGAHHPRHKDSRRNLAGLRALVTGGSSGVGAAVAVELCRCGVQVLATARRTEALEQVARSAAAAGLSPLRTLAGDITQPDFRAQVVAEARKLLGGIDIVVAAAGSGAIGPFSSADPQTLRQIMEIDFFAPAELVRACLPSLSESPDPAIVLVGSILGSHPLPLHAEYCAAKSALHSLAGSLRAELAPAGIDVALARLGPTQSAFWENLLSGEKPVWSRGPTMTSAAAAAAIVAGLRKRRLDIVPGWTAKGYCFAARFCPRLIDAVVARRLRLSR